MTFECDNSVLLLFLFDHCGSNSINQSSMCNVYTREIHIFPTSIIFLLSALEEQLSALDSLEKRLSNLEGSLSKYADAILTDETRFSRIKEGVFYSNIDSKWFIFGFNG